MNNGMDPNISEKKPFENVDVEEMLPIDDGPSLFRLRGAKSAHQKVCEAVVT